MKRLSTTLLVAAALFSGAAAAESIGMTPRLDAVPPPAESTAFKPDPNLVALGKRVFSTRACRSRKAPHARRAMIRAAPSGPR